MSICKQNVTGGKSIFKTPPIKNTFFLVIHVHFHRHFEPNIKCFFTAGEIFMTDLENAEYDTKLVDWLKIVKNVWIKNVAKHLL